MGSRRHLVLYSPETEASHNTSRFAPLGYFTQLSLKERCYDSLSIKHRLRLIVKRAIDLLVSVALLIALCPLLFLITLLIYFTSPGSILFRQTRVGLEQGTFKILKFRTMHSNVCSDNPRFDHQNNLVKRVNDPRLTKVGRCLRRLSIDELPQLINVLRGEMSLVGPRPLPKSMLCASPALIETRAAVRPGITGLWQIRQRQDNTSLQHMIHHDLEYISTLSVRRDIVILLRTVQVVIRCDGAV